MAHPAIENRSGLAFDPLFLADEEGQPLFVPVVKATYTIQEHALALAEKQVPVNVGGEFWEKPENSSYKYEPECAFTKLATDVVLIGHAHCTGSGTTETHVRLRVGELDKTVHVTGDRYWVKSLGVVSMTSPEPFESIPLVYERAFGGWDRSHPEIEKHTMEPRNPVGTGFRSRGGTFEEGIRLPNLEDPANLIRNYRDRVAPAGFGFTGPDWQPRATFAGTYDAAWMKNRMPLLPEDFDRRFFNAAGAGLIAPGYLRGDEVVLIENASPRGTISFNLPGVPPPNCLVQLNGKPDARVGMNLDTVIINTDEGLLLLVWRGLLSITNGPHDVVSVRIQAEGVSVPAVVR